MEYFNFVSRWDPDGVVPRGEVGTGDPTTTDPRMPCPCSGELSLGSESRPFLEIPDLGGAFPGEGPSMWAGTPSSAGSASSTGSEGSPPWTQAVLLSRDAREPTTPPAPTPSPSPGDEGSPGGELEVGSANPDEVVLDPAEAEFLQSDVWHQNRAFVPIGTITEGAEGESPPHPPLPMDYEASEGGAGTDGIRTDGILIDGAGTDGILIDGADTDGILIDGAGTDGILIDRAGTDGILIDRVGTDGILIDRAGTDGILTDGILIDQAGTDGILTDGILIDGAGTDGILTDGILIDQAGTDGILIDGAGIDGILTAGVGTAGILTDGAGNAGAGTAGSLTDGAGTAGSLTDGAGNAGAGTAGSLTAGAGTVAALTTVEGTATQIASYVVTMHKEAVCWSNECTDTEVPLHFPFGGQVTSSELQRPSRSEKPLPSGSQDAGAYTATVPDALSPLGAHDPLVSEILGVRPTQPPASLLGRGSGWEAGAGEGGPVASDEEEREPRLGEVGEEGSGGSAAGSNLVGMDVETGVTMETADLKALLANGGRQDREVAKQLASKLYHLDGFQRTEVAPYLDKNNEFSQMLAEEYLQLFDFCEMSLDQALRKFLTAFVLTGETQERERVLDHFSGRFQRCNPEAFRSRDAVHTITCALMLLNTDLHGQNLGKSMSSQDFVTNLEGMNDGKNFPRDMLKALYQSIKTEKLEWAVDAEELQKSLVPDGDDLLNVPRVKAKGNPFLEVPPDEKAPTYKEGLLSRKVHADIDGKKTPWGKRRWKTFYAILKGTVIYLMKQEEFGPSKQASEEAISIHHSLACRAEEYNKRPHVFRLKTADWRIFLFQAENAEQMSSWITRINLVAAMFSSPPFPAAVGSKRKFNRPILPSVTSKQSEEEQLESHDAMLQSILDDLDDHQMTFPDRKWKAKDFEEYKLKQEYFEYEKRRIETYVNLLKVKLNEGTDDLERLEGRLRDCADGCSALKKSHSSPSLNLELQTPVVKVKRNVSERRTYRKILPSRRRKAL